MYSSDMVEGILREFFWLYAGDFQLCKTHPAILCKIELCVCRLSSHHTVLDSKFITDAPYDSLPSCLDVQLSIEKF